MKVDGPLSTGLAQVGEEARQLEALGYDGAFSFEGAHDPFMPLALAATTTKSIELMTAIAIAFVRSPVTLAAASMDLQGLSRGRFILGLGSQVRAHIVNRYSMPWSHPAARMRELILAIRAVWATWQEGQPLNFQGEFYRHTLMTPMFNPGPSPYGVPRIFLAGVGEAMTEVAGEVADGFIVHPFSTQKFLRERTWPALMRGLQRGGRRVDEFEVAWQLIVSPTDRAAPDETADRGVRERIAFYGSTPAYRSVLEVHGWADLQPELRRLSKLGDWEGMTDLITDDVVDVFAVRAHPDELADAIRTRAEGLATRVSLDTRVPTLRVMHSGVADSSGYDLSRLRSTVRALRAS
jgi:probable F420-dependent oxidoreductase